MRRERIRKNRRTLYLTLTGIGAAVIFVAVFMWLVLRGAKVQGPVASSSSSVSSSVTVTHPFNSGTYKASGTVIDLDRDQHDLTVYVKLTDDQTYTRLLILDPHGHPFVVNDTGSFKRKNGKLTLTSEHANVYEYASATTYKNNKPTAVRQYSVDGATGTVRSYTKTLTSELNNTITLKNKTPHSYRYVETNLPLSKSKKKLTSLAKFKTTQETASTQSSTVSSAPVIVSQPSEPPSSAAPAPSVQPSVESQQSTVDNSGSNHNGNNNNGQNESQTDGNSHASSEQPSPSPDSSSAVSSSSPS
ncbi:hypothetical protein [Lacticaseibacillus paracasei]|uniref:hypothetical protein n=1 Tax=Lacticaseibacillus paracasei TaxID=1597 RepID=UPI001890C00F|nr:hypothetical protein [Lacticaseibacillus paracasei]QPB56238.1 hypothetical protein GFB64_03455 [Lacticaseibacillus paracasei]WPQ31301.1 hypothetical protein SH597_03210 [Lacticaseibacillus paracasei]